MRNWPYWLKGGIYAAVAGLILAGITFGALTLYPQDFMGLPGPGGDIFLVLAVILTLPQIFVGYNLVINLVISFILYFLIGAIIGWIYGKIKNRNKTEII